MVRFAGSSLLVMRDGEGDGDWCWFNRVFFSDLDFQSSDVGSEI